MSFLITSHWDGRMSSLDGETFETYEAAFAACQTVARGGLDDGMCAEPVDHGYERAWLVYVSEEARELDSEGRAHNACARIETISVSEVQS